MKENYKTQEKIYDAEVLESSTFDENIIIKILIKAGRTIAKPALEVLEMALDPYTLAEVARHMSCSREYCRQVVQRALRKLRKAGIQNGLVDSIS